MYLMIHKENVVQLHKSWFNKPLYNSCMNFATVFYVFNLWLE